MFHTNCDKISEKVNFSTHPNMDAHMSRVHYTLTVHNIEKLPLALVIERVPCVPLFVWLTTYEHTELSEWPVHGGIFLLF